MGFLKKNLGLGDEGLIKAWVDRHNIKHYKIHDDKSVSIFDHTIYLIGDIDPFSTIRIRTCNHLHISRCKFTTMNNFPINYTHIKVTNFTTGLDYDKILCNGIDVIISNIKELKFNISNKKLRSLIIEDCTGDISIKNSIVCNLHIKSSNINLNISKLNSQDSINIISCKFNDIIFQDSKTQILTWGGNNMEISSEYMRKNRIESKYFR